MGHLLHRSVDRCFRSPERVDRELGNPSEPTVHTFAPVVTESLRYAINNCDIEHGWLYELEVFGP